MITETLTNKLKFRISNIDPVKRVGKITKVIGLVIESSGPKAPIGELCNIIDRDREIICQSEIVGFLEQNRILSMVLGDLQNIEPGMEIVATSSSLRIGVGETLLGRVINGIGKPIDGLPETNVAEYRSIYATPPNPLTRKRITEPLATGVKAIDGILTLGKGQRIGIFSGSGIGKSTLLGMIARNTAADINVICLVGERGREVKEFIEKDLGEDGLRRSVVVVATSDTAPLMRVKAPLVATTIAEYFRDKGLDVMLMVDSATRLAMAQREVGLTIGEPPTSKGYTPSVFSFMQKTMERAGTSEVGSITGMYTVLVEGDDMNEPIADAARGILDGHIVLSRKLASLGHYPAIDVLESISRVRNDVISPEHKQSAQNVIELLAAYKMSEDLISVGAYRKGSNPLTDKAIASYDNINSFLKQNIDENADFNNTIEKLLNLV